ncbi:hypothetical protein EON62_05395 [archaeon]|nr:MAG: hypothetical protein EON62_05395 [archaeon]
MQAVFAPRLAAHPHAPQMASACTMPKEKLAEQMEFYFSDANYRRDAFLRGKVESNADRWVPVSVFTTFNRLKSAGVTEADIVEALQTSSMLELSDDKASVRRATPFSDVAPADADARTLYVKAPFPSDMTLDSLQELFKQFGKVNHVYMRRTRGSSKEGATTGNLFKGSVFVEFATEEAAAALLAKQAEGAFLFEERPVERVEKKVDYYTRKRAEFESNRAKRAACTLTASAPRVPMFHAHFAVPLPPLSPSAHASMFVCVRARVCVRVQPRRRRWVTA